MRCPNGSRKNKQRVCVKNKAARAKPKTKARAPAKPRAPAATKRRARRPAEPPITARQIEYMIAAVGTAVFNAEAVQFLHSIINKHSSKELLEMEKGLGGDGEWPPEKGNFREVVLREIIELSTYFLIDQGTPTEPVSKNTIMRVLNYSPEFLHFFNNGKEYPIARVAAP